VKSANSTPPKFVSKCSMDFKKAQFDADFESDINEKVTEKLSFDLYYCVQKSLAYHFFG
jgi:hypothetical protein